MGRRKKIAAILGILFCMYSCKSNEDTKSEIVVEKDTVNNEQVKVDTQANSHPFEQIYSQYFNMGSALAISGTKTAKELIPILEQNVKNVSVSTFDEDKKAKWEVQSKTLLGYLVELKKSDDITILRKDYRLVTEVMIYLAKEFKGNRELYILQCKTDKGILQWLRGNKQLVNPFQDASEKLCAEIIETIKPIGVE